jgi:hypothetical protein
MLHVFHVLAYIQMLAKNIPRSHPEFLGAIIEASHAPPCAVQIVIAGLAAVAVALCVYGYGARKASI